MSLYSDEAIKVAQKYLGPAAKTFLERQTRSHMSGLELSDLGQGQMADLAKWVEISAGLLIDKTKAKELASMSLKI
jgi:hypothetical protein